MEDAGLLGLIPPTKVGPHGYCNGLKDWDKEYPATGTTWTPLFSAAAEAIPQIGKLGAPVRLSMSEPPRSAYDLISDAPYPCFDLS
jgi:hypothetical protein